MFVEQQTNIQEAQMNNLQLYHKMVQQFCQWFPQERITRIRNQALLTVGLYLSGSVHSSKIVSEWPLPGKDPSLVNRLNRFLNNPRMDVPDWYQPIAANMLAALAGQPIRLIIDCTKVGFSHRIMVVGLAYRKRTLPLAWRVYRGPKGHTTYQEQIELLRQVSRWLPADSPVCLLGDAGFQSVHLLNWLGRRHWHFIIRQPGRCKVWQPRRPWVKIGELALEEGQTRTLGWVRLTEKHNAGWFWLVMHWEKGEDEPWYLVSNRPDETQMIRSYRLRMWIEEMYGDFKGHGFDLEATHLRSAQRIHQLLLGVCIAYVWLIALGSWVIKNGCRHLIDHKSRRDKSYFRLGWDWIAWCFRNNRAVPIRFVPYYLK
jgi:hypothetical protein